MLSTMLSKDMQMYTYIYIYIYRDNINLWATILLGGFQG